MLSEELNLGLSQETDSLMNILQVQITRTINSAINDRVISVLQNAMVTLSSGQRDTESGSSPNNQEDREGSIGLQIKNTKKDSRSACDLRDTEGLSPYMVTGVGLVGDVPSSSDEDSEEIELMSKCIERELADPTPKPTSGTAPMNC